MPHVHLGEELSDRPAPCSFIGIRGQYQIFWSSPLRATTTWTASARFATTRPQSSAMADKGKEAAARYETCPASPPRLLSHEPLKAPGVADG